MNHRFINHNFINSCISNRRNRLPNENINKIINTDKNSEKLPNINQSNANKNKEEINHKMEQLSQQKECNELPKLNDKIIDNITLEIKH